MSFLGYAAVDCAACGSVARLRPSRRRKRLARLGWRLSPGGRLAMCGDCYRRAEWVSALASEKAEAAA